MIVNLSEAASNTMLNAIAGMMDGGSIELLSGDGKALAVLKLSNPAAKDAAGGEFEFNKIAEGDAVLAGQAKFARVVASDGSEINAVQTTLPVAGTMQRGGGLRSARFARDGS